MKVLTLNCQKGYTPNLKEFLSRIIGSKSYDFILLQEVDEKVDLMIQISGQYKILETVNPDNQIPSQLRILYRSSFILTDSGFISFAKMNKLFAKRGEPGFLFGIFDCGGSQLTIGSLHLHPSFPFYIRHRETLMVKDRLSTYIKSGMPVIFGGDLNLGYPWEGPAIRKLVSSSFSEATINIGSTLDSRYTEKIGTHPVSRIGNFLMRFNISIRFKTDRIFVDKNTANKFHMAVKVLPDRVSDHSPVELEISFDGYLLVNP